MACFRCKVCGFIYDEKNEEKKWKDLPENWVCPLCSSDKSYFTTSKVYECSVCACVYDELKESLTWDMLEKDWVCPVCSSDRSYFSLKEKSDVLDKRVRAELEIPSGKDKYLAEWARSYDETEPHFKSIHKISETGESLIEPMRSISAVSYWGDILFKGRQLAKFPLNDDENVDTEVIIGKNAKIPLIISTPLIISHMSFGALSREAKIALAKGSAKVKTAMCSGEGGILNDSLVNSYKYIFEYVPNKYSVNDEYLAKVDAVEIKIGQSAKPGMGGHLPGNKVTSEISRIKDKPEGKDIISPARFPDINSKEDLKDLILMLRAKTGGKPIGVKIASGHIEEDLEFILYASPDFITIDGRPGATGAAPKFIKDSCSIPTLFALYRARKFLDLKKSDATLIITGGFRVSSDFSKALALGADVVAIATSAMIACGCQQYRICNSGKCPVGIATQDPELRKRLNIDKSAERIANFLNSSTEEMKTFARITGNRQLSGLSMNDICTTNKDIASFTDIKHI